MGQRDRVIHLDEDRLRRAEDRPAGLDAEIEGRVVPGAVVLPRLALRPGDRVYVVDDTDRLRVRDVAVVRKQAEQVVLSGGIADGERVVVSPVALPVDGMTVRVLGAGGDL